jgi:ABC-type multidrug transport system ATPase subunit
MVFKTYIYILYRIWQHLTEITVNGDITAILTTHYIEEARQANIVNMNISLS